MPLQQFGEYRPDVSDYQSTTSQNVLNVVPRGDGYGPFNSLSEISAALAAACRGAFVAYKTDGSIKIFAATSTKIYTLDNSALTWSDVSKALGTYSALSSTKQWQFRQYGDYVIAVQENVAPQYFDLTSSTEFADLGGSPPQAAYIDIVGEFVVLAGLLNEPYRIQWSALGSATGWTAGTNSSDYQDFPDGGTVNGIAGGENGIIFQDQAIRRMTYAPGSPLIFTIERIAQDNGLFAPYSLTRAGERIFFYSTKGFHMIEPSGFPIPIGRERVDRTFFDDLDKSSLQMFLGAPDPRGTRVFFAYKSANGTIGLFDKVLCYDWTLDRFTPITLSGEYLLNMAQPGMTLEGLDALSASIDALGGSLDDYATSIVPELAAFNTSHKFTFFRGDYLEATLETPEIGTDARRILVRGFRPVTDAAEVYGSASARENVATSATAGTEALVNSFSGMCDTMIDTRYSRLKARIPAGEDWTFVGGVEPDIKQLGMM